MSMEKEIALKVQRNLQASQNISILHEFCQKTSKPLPEWTPFSVPAAGPNAYTHGMQLSMCGQKFECSGAANRQEAKKSCASAAIDYFEKQGVPFFLERDLNYVSLLFQLCQAASISNPIYNSLGVSTMFRATVQVYNHSFESASAHAKKSLAKEDCSKVAFEFLCTIPEVTNTIFLKCPSFAAQVTRQENASVKHEQVENQFKLKNLSDSRSAVGQIAPVSTITSFVDLIGEYYESRPELGKPIYNFRVIPTPNGVSHKAQLIMGTKNKISSLQSNKTDAAEDVAKQMFLEVHPDAQSILESIQSKAGKKHVIEEEDVFFSDEDHEIESYESMLRKQLSKDNCPEPHFEYTKGNKGYFCTGIILVRSLNRMESLVSLREHHSKGTAREDVSHDLFVLLKSNPFNKQS